jgi:CheY-like chemotaxis protein
MGRTFILTAPVFTGGPAGESRRKETCADDQLIADTLATIFSLAGYEARAACSAEKAFELIAGWPPHLAIVDVLLPAMKV